MTFFPRVVSLDKVKKIIQDLKYDKSAGGEIPVSILKECKLTFEFLKNCINKLIKNGRFPDNMKEANITHVFKKMTPLISPVTDLSASYNYFQKYMKGLFIISFQIILKDSKKMHCAVFEKHIILSMPYLNYYNHGKKN